MIYLELLISFLKIGLLSIGGGYATIPLIQNEVVNVHHWLNFQEFSDIITISQMTPGPIAVNTSTFVGLRIAGILGAIIATLGCIFFGFVISLLLFKLFQKYHDLSITNYILQGLKACSVGLIASAGITLLINSFIDEMQGLDFKAIIILAIGSFIFKKYKLSPMLLMLMCGFLGVILYSL